MDRLTLLQVFVRVVELGSFSAASRELGTSQPTVSKQIASLERNLDVQLLRRSTRRLSLTPEGERFFAHCQPALDALAAATASVGQRNRLEGFLRVSCPVAFGQQEVMPFVRSFLERHPGLQLDLKLSDAFVDLVEEAVDVAIRIGEIRDPSLIAYPIGITRRVTVAAATYFAERPVPQTPDDLLKHNCLIFSRHTTLNDWHFDHPLHGPLRVSVGGNFRTDNSSVIREAVLAGMGIGVCPVWLFGEEIESDRLRVVLEAYQPKPLPIHALHRRDRFVAARVDAFIKEISHHFKEHPWVSSDPLLPSPGVRPPPSRRGP
ncbi:LysR family transcriptional regulator [Cyanobium sp. ATX 6F1]|uniref:LysR family transcriptional regulator n=1 Tax=unclassified Cyanobium TaxID=2627006 RepID=UPI0020CD08FD|nr:LysR family transcriptional regulator [Cyanobium sp. ATX 6F1]MCP9917150.1 LysR family transcriptional regulator [Cyanobium sp. ATX 6F1]